jgi:hypothetical protein
MAQNGHATMVSGCSFLGVKPTSAKSVAMLPFDPERALSMSKHLALE